MLRWFAIPALLLSLSLCGCWKEPGKYNWNNAPGAEQDERLMWQAIREKAWNEVDHHLAPAFVGVNASGQKFDRAGWLEYWKNVPVTDLSLGGVTVEPDGPDMLVTYELHLAGAASAAASGSNVRVVSVWQQLKKGWVLTAQSLTPIR